MDDCNLLKDKNEIIIPKLERAPIKYFMRKSVRESFHQGYEVNQGKLFEMV